MALTKGKKGFKRPVGKAKPKARSKAAGKTSAKTPSTRAMSAKRGKC